MRLFMCGLVCFAGSISFVNGRFFARGGFDAVVAELRKRLDEASAAQCCSTRRSDLGWSLAHGRQVKGLGGQAGARRPAEEEGT
jgi:hypothetical protein